jgi:hypothetical protein
MRVASIDIDSYLLENKIKSKRTMASNASTIYFSGTAIHSKPREYSKPPMTARPVSLLEEALKSFDKLGRLFPHGLDLITLANPHQSSHNSAQNSPEE